MCWVVTVYHFKVLGDYSMMNQLLEWSPSVVRYSGNCLWMGHLMSEVAKQSKTTCRSIAVCVSSVSKFICHLYKEAFCQIKMSKLPDQWTFNPLNPELNPLCYLLALLAHHFLHVSRIRVKSLTLRLLMSYIYIYGAPILDVSRSCTTTHHSR